MQKKNILKVNIHNKQTKTFMIGMLAEVFGWSAPRKELLSYYFEFRLISAIQTQSLNL